MANRPLSKQEQDFVAQIKDFMFKNVSYRCIDKLTDFNDCRETGIKKDKNLRSIEDEEIKYYEATKGCYSEYKTYFGCIKGIANEILQSKEVAPVFKGQSRLSFSQAEFRELLLKDFKII